jgi:hypothetical protein
MKRLLLAIVMLMLSPSMVVASANDVKLIKSAVINYQHPIRKENYRFDYLKIYKSWAVISTCLVDDQGKDKTDFVTYLLKKVNGRWRVKSMNDEKWLDKKECKKMDLPLDIAHKLGYSTVDWN